MNTRRAALIRKGILAARDVELAEEIHLGHRIVRKVFAETLRRQQVRRLRKAEQYHDWYQKVTVNAAWHMDQLIRQMFPKPIPETFKAPPKPKPSYTVLAWHKHHADPTPYPSVSAAVARRTEPDTAERLWRKTNDLHY